MVSIPGPNHTLRSPVSAAAQIQPPTRASPARLPSPPATAGARPQPGSPATPGGPGTELLAVTSVLTLTARTCRLISRVQPLSGTETAAGTAERDAVSAERRAVAGTRLRGLALGDRPFPAGGRWRGSRTAAPLSKRGSGTQRGSV